MHLDPRLRHLLWLAAELFAALLLALALFVIVVRLALPRVGEIRPQIEHWAAEAIGAPVRIGAVDAYWPLGFDVTVVMDDVEILGADGQADFRFGRAFVDFDLFGSLLRRAPVVDSLHIDGLELRLTLGPEGVIVHGMPSEGEASAAAREDGIGSGAFAGWLLSQPRLEISSGHLSWTGADADARLFRDFSLRARNRGNRHALALQLDGGAQGGTLDLATELHGPADDPARWRGTLYIESRRVPWSPLLDFAVTLSGDDPDPERRARALLPARASVRAWTSFADGALTRLAGEALLAEPGPETAAGGLEQAAARFDWTPGVEGWQIDLDDLEFDVAGGPRVRLGPGGVQLRDAGGAREFTFGLASAELADVAALTAAFHLLPRELEAALGGMQPAGRLYNLRGRWAPDGTVPWRVAGEAWDLVLAPWQAWPGLEGLRVAFDATPDTVHAEVYGRNAQVTLPRLFREPLLAERLSARVVATATGDGWRLRADDVVAANADIATRSRLDLLLPSAGGAPWVDLEVGFRDGDAKTTPRYLPVGIMSDEVVAWLDRALTGGRVVEGGVLLHGPLDRFPFDGHDGRFEVRFLVDGVDLDYFEGWPRIDGISGWVTFDGRGMAIDAPLARLYGARLERVSARVADLTADAPLLTVEGSARGDVGDGLRYLTESPLRENFGDYLDVARGSGGMTLGLKLGIPLAAGRTRVEGTIDLAGAELDLPAFGILLQDASGRLDFTEALLRGSGLTGTWRDMPVTVDVRVPDTEAGGPRFDITGTAGAAQRDALLPAALRERIDGDLDWRATVTVREAADGDVAGVDIRATSDLAGVALAFPAPLGKAADAVRPLEVEVAFRDAAPPLLRASHGALSLAAELAAAADGAVTLPRAELRYATGRAELPPGPLWRIDFASDVAALQAWREFLGGLGGDPSASAAGLPPLELHGRLDEFPLGELLTLHEVDATVTTSADAWTVTLASRETEGTLRLPRGEGRELPVVVDLARLSIDYSREGGEGTPVAAAEPAPVEPGVDPRSLNGLRLDIGDLVVNGTDIGRFALVVEPVADGLDMTRLRLEDAQWTLDGTGRWVRTAEGEQSGIALTIMSRGSRRLFTALGLESQIQADEADYTADLHWPGAPSDFALARLAGTFTGELREGALMEVSPGVGRIFSLVNLRQLGRRLTLDFKDLFGDGTRFDMIGGSFTFSRGDAYTNDLFIGTSAATINIMGRTGLVTRDYDQVMTILPQISSTLTIAGTVLGGPVVGAAILLFDQAFSGRVDSLAEAQYRITGPWDEPVIERIQVTPPPAEGAGEPALSPD